MSRDRFSTGAADFCIEASGVANDPDMTTDKIHQDRPDVPLPDMEMPCMNDLTMPRRWRLAALMGRLRSVFVQLHRHFCRKPLDFVEVRESVERQHLVLLGVGFFLLVCWMIVSIWLINLHNGKKTSEEVPESKAGIVTAELVLPHEKNPAFIAFMNSSDVGGV